MKEQATNYLPIFALENHETSNNCATRVLKDMQIKVINEIYINIRDQLKKSRVNVCYFYFIQAVINSSGPRN